MSIRSIVVVPFLLTTLALVGCASSSPEPTYYLLRGAQEEGAGQVDAVIRVGLGRVIVAPYLMSSNGVVVETAPGQVRPARSHQWAEPIDSGIRWFLRAEIARALGDEVGGGLVDIQDWDYTIDVYIGRLHGNVEGKALIESAYVVRPRVDRSELREYYFSRSHALPREGYAALVEAQQVLLTGLADAIADDLRKAMQPPAPMAADSSEVDQGY